MLPSPSANQQHAGQSWSVPVVSHHLDGLLRMKVPGLLHPGTGRGSPRFSAAVATRRSASEEASSRLVDHSHSRCALHTPRRSPPSSSRAASLRPLPPRRCASTVLPSELDSLVATLDLVALLHCLVRSLQQPLPVDGSPLLPGLRSPPGFWSTRNARPEVSPPRPARPVPSTAPHRCRCKPSSTPPLKPTTVFLGVSTPASLPSVGSSLLPASTSDSESVRSDPSAIRRLRTLLGFVTSKNLVTTGSEEPALR
jgi:hypothetical protein